MAFMYPMPDKYLMLILDQRFTRTFYVSGSAGNDVCAIYVLNLRRDFAHVDFSKRNKFYG